MVIEVGKYYINAKDDFANNKIVARIVGLPRGLIETENYLLGERTSPYRNKYSFNYFKARFVEVEQADIVILELLYGN